MVGWLVGEKITISQTRKEVLVGWNVFNCPWPRSTFQRLELDIFINYNKIDKTYFFPQALLCGFSKLQLQTQATAQVGKSHSGRSRVQILLGPVPDEFIVNNGQR